MWQYDHRFGSYHNLGKLKGRGGRGLPPVQSKEYEDPNFHVEPRYWVQKRAVDARLSNAGWPQSWLTGWRDVTSAKLERTVVAGVIPRVGVGDKYLLMMPSVENTKIGCLVACLDSLPFDFAARQKVGGTALKYFTMKQFPVLSPDAYTRR